MEQNIGKIGEDAAAAFLESRGYKTVVRNYREKFGEIDIVSLSPGGDTTIFFEIKTMRQYSGNQLGNESVAMLLPEDQMSPDKMRKFRKVCEFFMLNNAGMFSTGGGSALGRHAEHSWQMDVLAIEVLGPGMFLQENLGTNNGTKIYLFKHDNFSFVIRHYENV